MWKILHGDVLRVTKTLPDNSFDACLSDPPYGLSFMGRRWDYSVPSALVWSEIERVMKPGAHGLIFGGSRTFHRTVVAIEDGGLEIRDLLMWIYGSGFPKSYDVSKSIDKKLGQKRKVIRTEKRMNEASGIVDAGRGERKEVTREITSPTSDLAQAWSGYGTALKPSHEPIALVRKYPDGTNAENAIKWETGGIAIDASRIGSETRFNEAAGITGRSAASVAPVNVSGYDGREVEGRWPANVIMDDVAGSMLDAQAGIRPGMKSGGKHREGYDRETVVGYAAGDAKPGHARGDTGGPSRFFYSPKADRYQREAGLENHGKRKAQGVGALRDGERGSREAANVHPTVKPIDLIRYLAALILPPKRDTPRRILVPYAGVSSEMIGCLQAGWDEVIGIEREAEYIAIAEARIRNGGVLSGLMDRKMRTKREREVVAGRSVYGVFADEGEAGKARRKK